MNSHIFNKFLVKNPSDKIVYLSDLDMYISAGAIVDLCGFFDISEIQQSTSLQYVLEQGWLDKISVEEAVDFKVQTANKNLFTVAMMFQALSLSSYAITKSLSYSANVGITDHTVDGLTGTDYREVI